jgi:4-hydroxyproline epimerase
VVRERKIKAGREELFTRVSSVQKFIGRIEEVTELHGKPAIIPSVEGWAKVYGNQTITIDPEDDPYAYGFQVI